MLFVLLVQIVLLVAIGTFFASETFFAVGILLPIFKLTQPFCSNFQIELDQALKVSNCIKSNSWPSDGSKFGFHANMNPISESG